MNENNGNLTFNDFDDDGDFHIEVTRKDHAGFCDDIDFYLNKDQLIEVKKHIDYLVAKTQNNES